MSPATEASPPRDPEEGKELSLPEIFEGYKDKWVAITVMERDKNFQPTRGRVVSYDSDRYRLRQKLLRYDDICIFYAGEPQYPLFL